ncbi:Glucosamine-6-phosphate deaminase [hydrothermal vent metagenome]|uniref:Glucosamine-6-phosphate deaminase n=1 Tax=hydrothermal vent metagenome TaxID=652676 RepID=A0A3B0UDL1_9ZZZZ
MHTIISDSKLELGKKAANKGSELIKEAILKNGKANIIVATGASQFEMLEVLVKEDINWSVVTCFHLDEYIGIAETHPASFRKYLKERFADIVKPQAFHYVNGEGDVQAECQRLHNLISKHPIDVAFVGIGENAHLAFNDPPADFDIEDSYLDVELDLPCREQQMGEGWFKSIDEVPARAISMSINRIMKSTHIICSVPDERKAKAVERVVNGKVTPQIPSSILQKHSSTYLFLDKGSASLLGDTIV